MEKNHLISAVCCAFALAATPCTVNAKGGGHSRSGSASKGANSGGSHAVRGHVKRNGTYVAPTRAKNPNGTKQDNYSSKGNVNPATGKEGTKDPNKP